MTETPRILVTGAAGLIGSFLVNKLRQHYGNENVIAADVRRDCLMPVADPFELLDISDVDWLEKLVVHHKIDWLFNEAGILSLACEENPQLAMKVNMLGFQNVMEVARRHNLRVFGASSVVTFGASTPKIMTPDVTIQRPTSLYGCTKVHNELIGEYYHRKFGVDFRCLRYPVVLTHSSARNPRLSIVGFAAQMFADAPAVTSSGQSCCVDVAEYSCLPYMYLDDCISATIKLMQADNKKLTQRVYNVQSFSVTAGQLADEIRKHVPNFQVDFQTNNNSAKQLIVDGIIDSVDDSNARADWNWQAEFDFEKTVEAMILKRPPTVCY